jgi:hypothetical protein
MSTTERQGFLFYIMKNTGQIVRSKKNGKSRYTPISNDILQSKTLTAEQKSILVHLLSLPEDWIVYKTEIWKDMNIGRDRFNKSWTGLVKLGYIVSVKIIDAKTNLIKGYNHIVREEPVLDLLTFGLTENQVSRESGSIQSNNSQSNNLQSNNIENNNILDTRTSIEKIDELDMFSKEAQKLADLELERLSNK